ncbi:MAG: DUF3795 domain-containing protein [Candidatus Saccharibacteria bacterium]
MMSYCGLLCSECPAYLATVNDDYEQKRKIAAEWSKTYSSGFRPEDINCQGCRSEVTIGYCKTCEIRACAVKSGFNDCSVCDKFGCGKLEQVHQHAEEARQRLLKLKSQVR